MVNFMTILNKYIPNNGSIVFASNGYQHLKSKANYDFYFKCAVSIDGNSKYITAYNKPIYKIVTTK